MQTIYLEKKIDLNHELKELISLSVDESIHYKMEHEGIRAVGSLMVKGEYKAKETKSFQETLELDILATFDKIVDQRDFNIKVEDFDYTIKEGNLIVQIEAGVHGVISGENRYIKEDPLQEIESLMEENDQNNDPIEVDPITEEQTQDEVDQETQSDPMNENEELSDKQDDPEDTGDDSADQGNQEELQEVVYESKKRPMFQDTSDSVGVYYLYVTKPDDNYESIAAKYNVDIMILRDYNQNREIDTGSIIIVPYIP